LSGPRQSREVSLEKATFWQQRLRGWDVASTPCSSTDLLMLPCRGNVFQSLENDFCQTEIVHQRNWATPALRANRCFLCHDCTSSPDCDQPAPPAKDAAICGDVPVGNFAVSNRLDWRLTRCNRSIPCIFPKNGHCEPKFRHLFNSLHVWSCGRFQPAVTPMKFPVGCIVCLWASASLQTNARASRPTASWVLLRRNRDRCFAFRRAGTRLSRASGQVTRPCAKGTAGFITPPAAPPWVDSEGEMVWLSSSCRINVRRIGGCRFAHLGTHAFFRHLAAELRPVRPRGQAGFGFRGRG